MLSLTLGGAVKAPLRLLCLGAHPDDIEIGCGGTISRLVAETPDIAIRWVVFTGNDVRAGEARASAAETIGGARHHEILLHDFRDGFLPYEGMRVKDAFESLKQGFDPTLILTHHLRDAHQDHRLVSELTHNTFRNHLILEYEIPKHDGDLGNPGLFVALTEAQARQKAASLIRHFATQRQRAWFNEETFLALMRLRGTFAPTGSLFAEGFYCRKAMLLD